MTTRVRLVLVLAAFTAAQCSAAKAGSSRVDSTNAGQTPRVVCSISTADPNWRQEGETSNLAVEIRSDAPTAVTGMLSLRLSAVPRRDELSGEYWAPFDLPDGHSTKSRQTIQPTGGKTTSIRLLPARLDWGTSTSSVWPARAFATVVPPGRYTARVRIQTDSGADVSSKEVRITVVKRAGAK